MIRDALRRRRADVDDRLRTAVEELSAQLACELPALDRLIGAAAGDGYVRAPP